MVIEMKFCNLHSLPQLYLVQVIKLIFFIGRKIIPLITMVRKIRTKTSFPSADRI